MAHQFTSSALSPPIFSHPLTFSLRPFLRCWTVPTEFSMAVGWCLLPVTTPQVHCSETGNISVYVHVFDRLWKTVVYGFGAQHWEFRPFLICAVRTTLRLVYLGRSRIGWTGSRFVNIQVFHKPFCLVRKKNQWSANVPKFSLLIKLRSADFMESRYPEASSHAYPVV